MAIVKILNKKEITDRFLDTFQRYQEVSKCWRYTNNEWKLLDICFIEEWSLKEKERMCAQLRQTIINEGEVHAIYGNNKVLGFASIENRLFGTENQYIQLSEFYISSKERSKGYGTLLFQSVCEAAKKLHASKLYISSHSCEETVNFYMKLGCVDAKEINDEFVLKEPCDRQLEYQL